MTYKETRGHLTMVSNVGVKAVDTIIGDVLTTLYLMWMIMKGFTWNHSLISHLYVITFYTIILQPLFVFMATREQMWLFITAVILLALHFCLTWRVGPVIRCCTKCCTSTIRIKQKEWENSYLVSPAGQEETCRVKPNTKEQTFSSCYVFIDLWIIGIFLMNHRQISC